MTTLLLKNAALLVTMLLFWLLANITDAPFSGVFGYLALHNLSAAVRLSSQGAIFTDLQVVGPGFDRYKMNQQ